MRIILAAACVTAIIAVGSVYVLEEVGPSAPAPISGDAVRLD